MINRYRNFSIVMVCIFTMFLAGCGSDDGDSEPTNEQPIVDSFIVPTEFNRGDVFEFSVIAYDNDGDTLSYTWEVDAGKLNTITETNVEWTAPEEDIESVKVTVYVSDGVGKSTKRVKRIANKEFITPDPPLNLIVPGRGAFGVKLGDPYKKVTNLHGKPNNPPGADRFFTFWDPDIGFAGFVDGIDLLEDLFLSHPNKAKTVAGNGIGTTVEKLEREFGNAEEIDGDNFGGTRHWYWKRGIEFTFDNEDEIATSVFIFKPLDVGQDVQIRPQQPIKNEANKLKRLRVTYSKHSGNNTH